MSALILKNSAPSYENSVCSLSKLSNGAIGKWERSIYGPSLSQLLKLAKYFKVTLNELVVYDEADGKNGHQPHRDGVL